MSESPNELKDSDGRDFLDMTMAWGAALVGHAHPTVVEPASKQALLGANFASVNCRSVELVERLHAINPFLERLRLVASGTEATLLCLRVAVAATGRRKILLSDGLFATHRRITWPRALRPAASARARLSSDAELCWWQ